MIRKILVPVRGDGKGNNVLCHAAVIAKRFNAHVLVAHCQPRPQDMLPYGVPLPAFMKKQLLEQASELGRQSSAGMKSEFETLAASFGLTLSDGYGENEATASWIEESGRQVEVIRHHGRLADLVAVAKPDRDRVLGVNSLRSALLHTGRPALMCPDTDQVAADLGSHVAIAWNGSTEAAHAVALSLGLIDKADTVTILTAEGRRNGHTATAEDLKDYLRIRGIESNIESFKAKKQIGVEILERTKAVGANLLVMGAYGESHEKEIMFGGNTQTIIDEAKMPIVMVH